MSATQIETVLVVEDDATSRYLATSILKRLGIGKEVLTAQNGLEALKMLQAVCGQKGCPELILLDIKMPVMDGFELLGELHNAPEIDLSQSRIIILTSSGSPKDVERIRQYPSLTYMHKPITKEKLQQVLAG